MDKKKTIKTVTEEVLANGIGWVAGLFAVQLLDKFFIEKHWWNLWGVFSKRTAISGITFSILEWTLTGILGFAVMILVNKFVRNKFLKKKAIGAVSTIGNKFKKNSTGEVEIENPALDTNIQEENNITTEEETDTEDKVL